MTMKIAYVTEYDARDRRFYAGTPHYMTRSFDRLPGVQMDYVGPLKERGRLPTKALKLLYRVFSRKAYHRNRNPYILKGYARQTLPRLDALRPDVVFTPTSMCAAYLETDRPLVLWSDATFAALVDFYPDFFNLSARTLRDGHRMEQATLDRCSLLLYSSDWAAQSAIRDYGADPAKVQVVPYGANLEADDRTDADLEVLLQHRPADRCRLLMMGVDWERKGGPQAYAVAKALNDAGLPTELTVVGCTPPLDPLPPFVHAPGFINKNTAEGQQQLEQALAEAHFLILPATADCTPIVLCEANAFGLPCLTSDVGGITTTIRNGRNGFTFPLDAPPAAYRDAVLPLFEDYPQYLGLARSSFQEYRRRLNWPTAVQAATQLLSALL